MKPEMIFMAAVFGMGAIHLLFSVVGFFRGSSRPARGKGQAAVARDDWYVFFDRGELLGTEEAAARPGAGTRRPLEAAPVHDEAHGPQEAYV